MILCIELASIVPVSPYIHHHTAAVAKFAPDWFPVKLTEDHKNTRIWRVVKLLRFCEEHGEALLSRIITAHEAWVSHNFPESKAEWITWKHPHSPRDIYIMLKTVQSPGKVTASVLFNVYCVLCSIGWFYSFPFDDKCSCLSGNSEEAQGDYSTKETRMLTKGVLLLHHNTRLHSSVTNTNLLTSWDWEIFHIHHTVLILSRQTSMCSQKLRSTSNVSIPITMKLFKMKSRIDYVPRRHFVSLKDLTI
jgi:hypothetical protein